MSANTQAMAAMLAQGLGGQQQQGGMVGQNSGALGAAGQLAQKIMLMQALQKGMPPQQPGQPAVPAQLPGALQPQQMNQMPVPGVGVNA